MPRRGPAQASITSAKAVFMRVSKPRFEIERERPSANKAEAFATLLAQARQSEPVTPDYLVSLQQVAVTNPLDRADAFRAHQNWLRNGMPGVLSARWSGKHGDDDANLDLLLGQLGDVPDERRGAAFVSVVAMVVPGGEEVVVRGEWRGTLLRALEAAIDAGRIPTDEAQAIEWSGQRPLLIAGRADNIKVTTADDLALAAAILSVRSTQEMR